MFCLLPVVLIATPNNRRRSFFFRFQRAERRTGGHPKIAVDPLCLKDATLCLFSHLNLVLSGFAHHKSDFGWSTFGGALERCRRSCTPSTSGTGLKVEKPGSDPQRNCLDWRAHQVWWINSVKKSSGNIFEGWWFFCYVFTHCWLLLWRTKLKVTPCTKLADTKWKTSITALKTDQQSQTNFQLAFLQLMYLSWFCLKAQFTSFSKYVCYYSKCSRFC